MIEFFKKLIVLKELVRYVNNWYVPMLFYFNILNEDKRVNLKNGITIIMRNKSDSIAFFENFILRLNNPRTSFEIKNNDIVVDIGAHVGYFTIYAAKKTPKGKIYSIEPFRGSFEILKKNIELNELTNVELINSAISKTSGKIKFYVNKNSDISNSIFNTDNSLDVEVNSFTLNDIIVQNNIKKIDFLKMDCEGAEFEILLNLDQNILKKIHKISAEIHIGINDYSEKQIIEFLAANNFAVEKVNIKNESKIKLSMIYAINKF